MCKKQGMVRCGKQVQQDDWSKKQGAQLAVGRLTNVCHYSSTAAIIGAAADKNNAGGEV
jgi:hypothetical protein